MRLRIVVVGVPGVGKTTIVGKLMSLLKGPELVTFGTVMLDVGIRRRWIKHRDQMRNLPVEKQEQLQTIAARRIAAMRGSAIIVDTHLFIRTKEGFWPGLPFEVIRALRPTHLILVEARPDEIANRRASDSSRYRDSAAIVDLVEEMALARSFLAVSSTLSGAPMLIVRNDEGKADEAARHIARALGGAPR